MRSKENFEEILNRCKNEFGHLEIWPGYFERRYLEFVQYYSCFPKQEQDLCLELGCGMGYHSAFLAKVCKQVISTDLEEESADDHAIGLKVTREFLHKLNIDNVDIKGCSAEQLPFPDNHFNFVYSNFVMEHVPDRKNAFKEIHRVLKPGGYHFCIVPTRFDKFYAIIYYYLYLLQRIIFRVNRFFSGTKNRPNNRNKIAAPTIKGKSMLRHFPFPPPHGAYQSFLSEWLQWSHARWSKQIIESGSYEMISQVTTQMNPIVQIFFTLFPQWCNRSKKKWMHYELRLGKNVFFKIFGYNSVMLFKKK